MTPRYNIIHRTQCCGVRELYGIYGMTPEHVVFTVGKAILEQVDYTNGVHFLFHDNTMANNDRPHYGGILRDFINVNGLGTVVATEVGHNPNSGRMLQTFVWTIERESLLEWTRTKDRELLERLAEGRNRALEQAGLAIGDFVRFTQNSPNFFAGRAVISHDQTGSDTLHLTTQAGVVRSITLDEVNLLTKTRRFTI